MDELENEFLMLETVCEDLKVIYLKNDDEARFRIVRAAELGAINSSDIVPAAYLMYCSIGHYFMSFTTSFFTCR